MKKIAIIIPSLRGGGAEKVMLTIATYLNKTEFQVKLFVINKEGPYIKRVPEDLEIIDLKSKRVRYSIPKLINELNNYYPDIIFSTLGHLNLVLLSIRWLLKGAPRIFVREANTPSLSLTKHSKVRRRIVKFLYRRLYPSADGVIAQCKEMKDDIINTFNITGKNITYIYNPVDINEIIKKSTEFNPYNSENKNILAVGRLTYQKGFDNLISAFEKVVKIVPEARLTILGEGELKESLLAQINEINLSHKIDIVSFKDNPYPYYKYADLYVLSSRWEGFPNTLLESLTCETPIVSTECKSGPREILNGGDYGALVDVESIEQLEDAIINTLTQKTKKSISRAYTFDIKKIIKKYSKLFN